MSTNDTMKTINDLGTKSWEQMNALGNKGMEHFNALGELNVRTFERLASRQMEAMSFIMEQGLRQMRLAGEVKGYGDLWKGEVELTRELGERMMSETKENLRLVGEMRDEYRSWMQSGVSTLTASLRKEAAAAA